MPVDKDALVRTNVMLRERDIEDADRMAKEDGHTSRSQVIRQALRLMKKYRARQSARG